MAMPVAVTMMTVSMPMSSTRQNGIVRRQCQQTNHPIHPAEIFHIHVSQVLLMHSMDCELNES
ncbi:hypothetical protein SAMN05216300_12055 [Nitrosomonas oligotropha]|nr:hypothetical protein SAMN05216300_12055 [Nitrosomonas oligotropha]